ncbi:MAG: tetratricopeptide repeat protein [Acidobacteria bacterium]|nr:tetratricopeptide repeat protein [Acidobacteriota bacterium]
MKTESIVFAVAGALFGLIVGWVIGTQQIPMRIVAGGAAAAPAAQTAQTAATPATRPALDESQAAPLRNIAERDPRNVPSRVHLGDMYFDAGRYQEATRWYEEALALVPKDVNVSTDLAICYYYTDQADRAITQMSASLAIDPKHTKTWLNLGVVKAFGKQDLAGATEAWNEVIKLAPGSEEASSAQRALDNLKAAHPDGAMPPAGSAPVAAGASPSGILKK